MSKEVKEGLRIPRPTGFTLACKQTENKEELKEVLIEQYVSNGYKLNNKTISIDILASYLNLPLQTVILKIVRRTKKIADVLGGEDGLNYARVIQKMALEKSWQASSEAQAQLNVLKAAQAGIYVPFTSSEVNKSVANLIASGKLLQDTVTNLFGTFKGTGNGLTGSAINIQNNLVSNASGQYMDVTKANAYLTEKGYQTALNNPQILLDQVGQEELGTLPDVRANHQDLRSIGVKFDGTKVGKLEVSPIPGMAPEKSKTGHEKGIHHADRRQHELGILDEEDLDEDAKLP